MQRLNLLRRGDLLLGALEGGLFRRGGAGGWSGGAGPDRGFAGAGSTAADAATAAATSAASSFVAAASGTVSTGPDSVDWGSTPPSFSESSESPISECDFCEPFSAAFPDFFEDFFPGFFFFLPPIASAQSDGVVCGVTGLNRPI